MLNIGCDVVLDLIPLVKDGVASEDSIAIVHEHIKNCHQCKAEFETFEAIRIEQASIKDERVISAIKRSIFITQVTILIAGAVLGVAMTNSMNMFYNFIIMPIIGGVSFIAFKRRWHLAPIGVFILTYLWQTVEFILSEGFQLTALHYGIFYSIIYSGLVGLGIIITMLLEFAFRKEGQQNEK